MFLRRTCLALTAMLCLAAAAEAQRGGGRTLTLYSGLNYTGESVTIRSDVTNFQSINFNDRAQSVQVDGAGSWTLCHHANFRGVCHQFSTDTPDLNPFQLGGNISSARMEYDAGPGYPGGGPGGGFDRPRNGIVLFDGRQFNGDSVHIRHDNVNLMGRGFNDRARSVLIAPGEAWEFCQHANYRGRCITLDDDAGNLGPYNLNDTVSSVRRLYDSGRPGSGGRPGNGFRDGSLTLYAGPNFTGAAINFDREISNLTGRGWNDRAMSLVVEGGGSWTICEDANFGSPCRTVSGRVRNLNAFGLGNQVSSIRPDGYGGPGYGDLGGYYGPEGTLTLFAGPNFTGASIVIDRETSSLVRLGWNDRAMSAIVNGYEDWTICEDVGFGTPCRRISGEVRNLNVFGLGNRISSVRPEGGGYYGPKSDRPDQPRWKG